MKQRFSLKRMLHQDLTLSSLSCCNFALSLGNVIMLRNYKGKNINSFGNISQSVGQFCWFSWCLWFFWLSRYSWFSKFFCCSWFSWFSRSPWYSWLFWSPRLCYLSPFCWYSQFSCGCAGTPSYPASPGFLLVALVLLAPWFSWLLHLTTLEQPTSRIRLFKYRVCLLFNCFSLPT